MAKRHELTKNDRSKGGHARVEKLREQRETAAISAQEKLADAVEAAVERLVNAMADGGDTAAVRAASSILDRVLGKAGQHLQGQSGPVEKSRAVMIAKEQLTKEYDARAPAVRVKLMALLERRAEEIAAGKGDATRLLPYDLSEPSE